MRIGSALFILAAVLGISTAVLLTRSGPGSAANTGRTGTPGGGTRPNTGGGNSDVINKTLSCFSYHRYPDSSRRLAVSIPG